MPRTVDLKKNRSSVPFTSMSGFAGTPRRAQDRGFVITFPFFVIFMAIPYLCGMYLSHRNLDIVVPLWRSTNDFLNKHVYRIVQEGWLGGASLLDEGPAMTPFVQNISPEECMKRLNVFMYDGLSSKRIDDPLGDLKFLHIERTNLERTTISLTSMDELLLQTVKESGCPRGFRNSFMFNVFWTQLISLYIPNFFNDYCRDVHPFSMEDSSEQIDWNQPCTFRILMKDREIILDGWKVLLHVARLRESRDELVFRALPSWSGKEIV